jgi:hypothetical protein
MTRPAVDPADLVEVTTAAHRIEVLLGAPATPHATMKGTP